MMTGTSRFGFVLLLAGALVVTCLWISSQDPDRATSPQSLVAATYDTTPQADVFYVLGTVGHPGPYEVRDVVERRLSVKTALVAAGTPAPLPWPKYAQLFRRIGENEDLTFELDFVRIFHHEDPELLLKPNDILVIGHGAATVADWPEGDQFPAQPVERSASARRFVRW